ncbi:MAG: hypothetical protein ACFBZ8_00290 [Opitutales bacterium]
MANKLPAEKKSQVVSALCEGSSIRSIERMTGIHRDTIMRLGTRMGEGCAAVLDDKMRDLDCSEIQVDEIWGFIGKKQKRVQEGEAYKGDVWTYIALDPRSKAIPCYAVGKRDYTTTNLFIGDLSTRMCNRIQLSSDAMGQYKSAVETAFGVGVDYGQIVKTFSQSDVEAARKYSPPNIVSARSEKIIGNPHEKRICTSHIEKQNHTLRMHCRRLTRLTNAFSKKLENFKAAVALSFAYYNFCRVHKSIRCTPAMELGVATSVWTVADLVEMIER